MQAPEIDEGKVWTDSSRYDDEATRTSRYLQVLQLWRKAGPFVGLRSHVATFSYVD